MITASGCVAKKIAQQEPGQKGLNMEQLSPENTAATKVIAKACKWVDRRRAVLVAPQDQKARESGRYEQSGKELVEAVDNYRKAGKAGHP